MNKGTLGKSEEYKDWRNEKYSKIIPQAMKDEIIGRADWLIKNKYKHEEFLVVDDYVMVIKEPFEASAVNPEDSIYQEGLYIFSFTGTRGEHKGVKSDVYIVVTIDPHTLWPTGYKFIDVSDVGDNAADAKELNDKVVIQRFNNMK